MTEITPQDNSGLRPPERQPSIPFEQQHCPDVSIHTLTYPSYFGGEVHVMEASSPNYQDERAVLPPDVYYAHGAGWDQERPTIMQIARNNRRAFAMDFIGDRQPDARFVIGHMALGDSTSLHHVTDRKIGTLLGKVSMIVPQQQMREAATLLAVITERQKHSPQAMPIDAIFQSESAGHGLIAAYTQPEAFRSIVLAFPGSLSGPQTSFIPGRIARDALARRPHRPMPDNDFRQPNGLSPHKALRMQLKAPGFKEDAAALHYSALAPMLHTIRQREHAPNTTLVAGLNDKIFELERYLKSLVSASDVDRIVVVPGGHAIGGRKNVLHTILQQLDSGGTATSPSAPLRERVFLPAEVTSKQAKQIMKLADEVDARTI